MWQNFKEVTGQDLQGLSQFTGWISEGGYYHWRVAQQGLVHLIPHLQRQPMPRTPDAHPSGKPLPLRPAQTETPSMGVSGKRSDGTQSTPSGSRQRSTLNQGGQPSTSGQGRMTTAPRQGGKSSTPHQSSEPASSSRSGIPAASGVLSTFPQVGEERVIVPGLTGTKWSCVKHRVESLSPQGLPI